VDLVVLDFDGVLTDNRVWVDEEGHEMVAANRSDSMGLHALRSAGVKVMVLSTEVNPVVTARCRKMKVPVYQGIVDKAGALPGILEEMGATAEHTIYLGNDTNDIPCFPMVACALVVADAQTDARMAADVILSRTGGHGVVRELCDLIIQRQAGT
jgi:YrbI family 3-deoxy-D-manno-octulosonate 8-phosphate phosphatase